MMKNLRISVLTVLVSLLAVVNARAITEVDGVYQITSAADFVEYRNLVTSATNDLKCVITADLDFTGVTYSPIGSSRYLFKGSIDGQGHKISNLVINTTSTYQGLVGYVGAGAVIKNLVIDNTCSIKGGDYTAAFAGGSNGSGTVYFENLGNEANVSGGTNTAAIVGVSMSGSMAFSIKNCYNTGDIAGSKESAAITGWMGSGSTVNGFFNIGTISGLDGSNKLYRNSATTSKMYDIAGVQGDSISEEMLASGVVAFALNGFSSENPVWYQTLGEDMYPVFSSTHGTVYYAGTMNCDMTLPEDYADYGFSNTNTTQYTEHDFVDGVCSVCKTADATWLTPVDSVYEISTPKQLYWFACYVNALEGGKAYARLTADIDFTEQTMEDVMIGTTSNYFRGWFDGQGHTISVNYDNDVKYGALFHYLNGTVKNLIVTGDVVAAGSLNGGIVGYMSKQGLIENCISDVNLASTKEGDASMGGVAGQMYGGTMSNCAFIGTMDGAAANCCGGLVGWSGESNVIKNCYVSASFTIDLATSGSNIFARNTSSVTNCYYLDAEGFAVPSGATQFNEEQLGNGELAYMLNGMRSDSVFWYQNLDNDQEIDARPLPFGTHGTVYAVGTLNCDGSPAESEGYSNTDKSVTTPHNYVYGICDFCHTVKKDYKTAVDGYFELATAEDLNWFAYYANTVDATAKAKLTADIDFTKYSADSVMIGQDSYKGTFDGQGHNVKVAYYCYGAAKNAALFVNLDGARIKNLSISGTVHSGYCIGSVAVRARNNTIIENCYSNAALSSDTDGDSSIGGIVASLQNHSIVRNCGFTGTIEAPTGTGNGGLVAYADGGVEAVVENCYVASTSLVGSGDNNAIFSRNSPTTYNCYYVDPGTFALDSRGTEVSMDQVQSGELCFVLNGNESGADSWTQTIGTDIAPLPFATSEKVYAIGELSCDGTPTTATALTFSNTEGTLTKPEHSFDSENVCGVCGARKIENGEQLNNLSEAINSGFANSNILVIVANDIDMSDYPNYVGIGTDDLPFTGTFEGNGHVISHMNINTTTQKQGLFGVVSAGAYIKDITVDNTCSVTVVDGSYAGGIIGSTTGTGLITLINCGNEANVTVSGANAAGIIGVNMGSSALLRLTNCYNAGTITGGKESAAISGWLGKSAELTNCYNIGEVIGSEENWTSYRRESEPTVVNCYETIGSQFTQVSDETVASGELCYLLNDSVSGGENYFQTLGTDTHPVLYTTHAKVYKVNGGYTNDVVGIKAVDTAARKGDGIERIYTVDGVRVSKLQKGVNIVRKADGTTQKVLVK